MCLTECACSSLPQVFLTKFTLADDSGVSIVEPTPTHRSTAPPGQGMLCIHWFTKHFTLLFLPLSPSLPSLSPLPPSPPSLPSSVTLSPLPPALLSLPFLPHSLPLFLPSSPPSFPSLSPLLPSPPSLPPSPPLSQNTNFMLGLGRW